MYRIVATAFAFVLCGAASAAAQGQGTGSESDYLSRFAGSWSGAGQVRKDAASNTWNVSCQVAGYPGPNRISIDGNCSAALIVNRQIGADLVYNPESGRYTGTYVGAKIGPARLSGSRVGDAVRLTITWPKPVNGDTTARMTVRNDGRGVLRITVADSLFPGGPVQTTSDIILAH